MSEPPSMTWQQPPTNESWIKRNKKLSIVIAAVILLSILLSAVGAILGDTGDTGATAQPTPTTTCDPGGCEETLGPTALPADETTEPATTTDLSDNIDKSDIELRVKILRKSAPVPAATSHTGWSSIVPTWTTGRRPAATST
jgi:hypothetical protein